MDGPDENTIDEIGPIWRELWGGVWHTTRPDRFQFILADRKILPEPPIPDGERWGTACGPDHYPLVRSIGGVSLFDFRDFDPATYAEIDPTGNWIRFVPYRHHWAGAIWLEVDSEKNPSAFISGPELVARRREVNELSRKIMPMIEAAYIGALPLSNIRRVLFIRHRDKPEFHTLDLTRFDRDAYKVQFSEWQEDFEAAGLPLHEQLKSNPLVIGDTPDHPDLPERVAEAQKRAD